MAWDKVRDEVLVKCGRHCCICHKFCGIKIELHHIRLKSEGGEDSFDNCLPLCFDCHADMKSYDYKHPKGTKYSETELRMHRDKWYGLSGQNLGTGTTNHLEQDIKTFEAVTEILRPDPTIHYLRDWDFGSNKFSLDSIGSITILLQKVRLEPWIEFFDSDIESIKQELLSKLQEFENEVNRHTFHFKSGGDFSYNCVPIEWVEEQPERYNEVVKKLNDTSIEIVGLYEGFIRICRKKLGVNL